MDIKDLKVISNWLDSKFTGPFGIKFGFDALIGLIPGIGDLLTTFISSYVVIRAAGMNVPKIILAKMGLNILIDQIIGTIPLIGDIFDFAWKSNEMNYQLILTYSQDHNKVLRGAWLNIVIAALIGLSLFIIPIYIMVLLLQLFF